MTIAIVLLFIGVAVLSAAVGFHFGTKVTSAICVLAANNCGLSMDKLESEIQKIKSSDIVRLLHD